MKRVLVVAAMELAACGTAPSPATPPAPRPSATISAAPAGIPPAPRFAAIVAGDKHACALESSGQLWCWGDDSFGQLGDGPPVEPLPPGASCHPPPKGDKPTSKEVLDAGARYCVAYHAIRSTPVRVVGGGFTAITAGLRHTCAIRGDGSVWCWGDNTAGQCGAADYVNHVGTPMRVAAIENASEVVAGELHTCARRSAHEPWQCVGTPHVAAPVAYTPRRVEPDARDRLGAASIFADGNDFACAVASEGVRCVGNNRQGQLGGGRSPALLGPQPAAQVDGIAHAVAVSDDGAHACALLADGAVRCWGDAHMGVLGFMLPHASFSTVPLQLDAIHDAEEVHTTGLRTCVRRRTGQVLCYSEALGAYPASVRPVVPEPLPSAGGAQSLALGNVHVCWLRADHTVGCEGVWEHGTAPVASFRPSTAKELRRIIALAVSTYRTCALADDGAIKCCGDRFASFEPPRPYGQMPTWTIPAWIATRKGAVELAMGGDSLCVRFPTGVVDCPVAGGKTLARAELASDSIALGDGPCWVYRDGTAACLAIEGGKARTRPIAGLTDAVSLGQQCALRRDGTVWCWGDPRLSGRGGVPDWSIDPVQVELPQGK